MLKKRAEFEEDLKWNVKDLYETEKDFFNDYQELEKDLSKFNDFKGHLLDSATTLYMALSFDTDFNARLERVYIYAHIQNDQDTRDTKFQTMYGKAYQLYEKYVEAISFIVPELLKSDFKTVEKYIKENPKLKEYERELKDIYKMKDHTLSEKEEQIISSLSSVFQIPDDTYSLLHDADMKFGKIKNETGELEELNEQSYRKFIESKDRKVRKSAFKKLLTTYGHFKNTYASLLAGEVKMHNRLAKIKNYESALEASLFTNDIPTKVYYNLIETVKKHIEPLSQFWELKKNALGVDELHIYDATAPIVDNIDIKYSVLEAKELLKKSLNVLGSTYIEDLMKAFDEKWIDFCSNTGKRGGAYCTACYLVHPYVLLSFDGSLNSVSTLAHELGHAMHYYYAIKSQKFQDYGYSIFVAEVASQVNQILLSKYLIKNANDINLKKYLIDDLIQDYKATIYRQTMFAEFELTIHELEAKGEVLTHELICDLYYKLNEVYQGKNIVLDKEIKYEWERVPHFYMNFYVYQYATAYAAAVKIAMDILNNKNGARENYLAFLRLGCTKTPIESLKIAGVDITSQETFDELSQYFEDLVKSLKELY